jgi:trigger factor
MKPGEEKEIEVTFPENYHQKDLAGEKATFKVKLNEIKRKEYPEINDDFAREISEFDTLAELKEDILNKLKEQEESRADAELRNKLIEMAAADSEVDLPEVLVERELDAMIQEMEQFLRIQGMTVEKFLEYSKKSMEDLRQDRKEEAQSRVKAGLVLDAIIEKEGISATDEELDEHLKTIADRYKQDVQKVKDLLAARGELDAFSQEIKYRKAIDFLVEQSDIVTEIIEKEKEPEADNAKNKEEIIAEQANNGKEPEVDSEEEVITDNGKEPEEKK